METMENIKIKPSNLREQELLCRLDMLNMLFEKKKYDQYFLEAKFKQK